MKLSFRSEYISHGVAKVTSDFINDDFTLDCKIINNRFKVSVKIDSSKPVEFTSFKFTMQHQFFMQDKIFTNGYQSWTTSKEYGIYDSMSEYNPRIFGLEKAKFNLRGIFGAGDLTFHKYPQGAGIFYGYSYAYVRNGNNIYLFGSMSERVGYTIITFNTNNNTIEIAKDLEGKVFENDAEILDLVMINDDYDDAFDKYFELMNIQKPKVKRSTGYTTWYNYYTSVTQDIVKNDLASIAKLKKQDGVKIDYFQIDDGYESTVGDWLDYDLKKFPDGMKNCVDLIHKNNMKAGLWLAPFAVTPKSKIYKKYKSEWLVKDKRGKVHYASHNWGGFYALDIYNPNVRAYIKKVFDTVFNKWKFDMVKLDFLYACSIIPYANKTRGEIMCDAVDFIRECCGNKIILGCGVPLHPAFGKFDFCRIGCDVDLGWENKAYTREDVSTQNTLTNTIFRRHLDGRAWLNDPDVFLLRDNNIKMSMDKREIVAKINSLFGNLLFVSDDVSTYDARQKAVFIDTVSSEKAQIISAEYTNKNIITVKYKLDENIKTYKFDILNGTVCN